MSIIYYIYPFKRLRTLCSFVILLLSSKRGRMKENHCQSRIKSIQHYTTHDDIEVTNHEPRFDMSWCQTSKDLVRVFTCTWHSFMIKDIHRHAYQCENKNVNYRLLVNGVASPLRRSELFGLFLAWYANIWSFYDARVHLSLNSFYLCSVPLCIFLQRAFLSCFSAIFPINIRGKGER